MWFKYFFKSLKSHFKVIRMSLNLEHKFHERRIFNILFTGISQRHRTMPDKRKTFIIKSPKYCSQ